MILDVSPRRDGKTSRAVDWLKGDLDRRTIVVCNKSEKDRIIAQYELRQVYLDNEVSKKAMVLMEEYDLTFNEAQEQALRQRLMNDQAVPVITWNGVLKNRALLGLARRELFIDNADRFLVETFGRHGRVAGISMTKEAEGL